MRARPTPPRSPAPRLPGGRAPVDGRWSLLGLGLATLLGACGDPRAGTGAGAAGEPRIVLEEDHRDFGEVWEGSLLEHDFRLRVEGGTVALHAISADCGCTGTQLLVLSGDGGEEVYVEETPLPEGTELVLRVEYSTRGKTGRIPRQVHLYGDQAGGDTTVTVEADVRTWMTVEPERRSLGPMRASEVQETTFVVQGRTGRRFLLEATGEGIPPALRVTTRAVDPDDDGRAERWTVGVTAGPGLPEGVRGYPIRLAADVENPDVPPDLDGRFKVMPLLTVEVVGAISLRPQVLTFSGLASNEIASATVRVTSFDPGFRLEEPRGRLLAVGTDEESELAATASLRALPVKDGEVWDVELILDGLADEVPTRFLARLVLETGHPEVPEVEVKVSGYRRDLPGAPRAASAESPGERGGA